MGDFAKPGQCGISNFARLTGAEQEAVNCCLWNGLNNGNGINTVGGVARPALAMLTDSHTGGVEAYAGGPMLDLFMGLSRYKCEKFLRGV